MKCSYVLLKNIRYEHEKSIAHLELHIKDLEKTTRNLELDVSHYDLDLVSMEKDLKNALFHMISVPYEGYYRYCRKWGIPYYPYGWHTVHVSFSVNQIITDLSGILKLAEELLKKEMNIFLKAILKTLNFKTKLSSIPGLGSLNIKL